MNWVNQFPGPRRGCGYKFTGNIPGSRRRHPLTLVIGEICDMFKRMGFVVVDGPEIESEYNNFTGLNIPWIILPGKLLILFI